MAETKKYEVAVKVQTTYLPEQSDEAVDRYVFAYTIVISNTGSIPAQLISRHWIIADGSGGVQESAGVGCCRTNSRSSSLARVSNIPAVQLFQRP